MSFSVPVCTNFSTCLHSRLVPVAGTLSGHRERHPSSVTFGMSQFAFTSFEAGVHVHVFTLPADFLPTMQQPLLAHSRSAPQLAKNLDSKARRKAPTGVSLAGLAPTLTRHPGR